MVRSPLPARKSCSVAFAFASALAVVGPWGCGPQPSNLFGVLGDDESSEVPEMQADAGAEELDRAVPEVDGGEQTSASGTSASGTGASGTNGSTTPAPTTSEPASTAGGGSSEQSPPDCEFTPFDEPVVVGELGVGDGLFGPTLSTDALALIFSAAVVSPAGLVLDENIFQATRSSRTEPFGVALPLVELNTPDSLEGTAYLTGDDTALYFFSNREDANAPGGRDIWRAERPSSSEPFSTPVPVEGINDVGLDHLPWVSGDEETILFVSNRTGATTGSNIWQATRAAVSDAFGTPVELQGINANSRDERPFLTEDSLTLLFCSNRVGNQSMDLWIAQRSSPTEPFGEPTPVGEVNSVTDDIDPTLSSDGTELFFSSNRSGTQQLFRAVRRCLP